MKRKFLSILLTLAMALTLLPTAAMADETPSEGGGSAPVEAPVETKVAQIGDVKYDTLAEAVEAVPTNNAETEIVLLNDYIGSGIKVVAGKNIVFNLNGKTYTVNKPTVGSSGTETNGFQLLKGSKVTFKNGALSSKTGADSLPNGGILIQNYCDLTLENVTLDTSANSNISYVISNNFGSLTATGNTVIKAADGKVAFDLWYGMNSNGLYDDGVSVTFGTDFTGSVTGKIEYGAHSRVPSNSNWKDKARLTIANGNFDTTFVDSNNNDGVAPEDFNISISGGTFNTDVSAYVADGYILNNGTVEKLGETNAVAKVGDTYYKTLAEAIAAAQNSETVTLLKNIEGCSSLRPAVGSVVTIDLNDHNIKFNQNQRFSVVGSTLNLIGKGTVEESKPYYSPVMMYGGENAENYSVLNVGENVTLKGWSAVFIDNTTGGKNSGIVANINGHLFGLKDTSGDTGSGVYVNGNIKEQTYAPKITMGATSTIEATGTGMYLAGYAETVVENGAQIAGDITGIEIRAGKLTVNGGVITGNGVPTSVTPNGNGTTSNGVGIAVAQHTTKQNLVVKILGGEINGYSALYESNPQSNSDDDIAKVTMDVADGKFKAINGGTAAVYSQNKNDFITGGLFSSDPSAYVAAGHYVDASNNGDYPYIVKEGAKPAGALIVVKDKTDAAVSNEINDTDKTAINNVIGKANVDGVAEAAKKADIVAKSGATVNNNDKVEIEVAVKVEAKAADLAKGQLIFEASPVATVTVTKANGSTETKDDVKVPNSMLNGQPITVKLPLPTVDGKLFTPNQILHKFTGGGYEYFINESVGSKRGAGNFKIEGDCAVFTIYGFSTFELSGTVTYVEPSSGGGSSSSSRRYDVSAPSVKHGDVTVSPKTASKGDTVTITVKPDSGYELDTLTVKDASGSKIKVKDKGDGKFTFTMPASKVTVSAEFAEIETLDFADVSTDAYYYEAVKWAAKKGITGGTGDGTFNPNGSCTRAHIVTFLWRAAGSPEPKSTVSFADVPAGSYYAKAVAWAVENGITLGTGDGTFSPNATCTRAQSVTFLYRALGTAPTTVNGFTDVTADAFYADAVAWAVESGVTNGTTDSTFSPNNGCTRAQIVTFLYRTMK